MGTLFLPFFRRLEGLLALLEARRILCGICLRQIVWRYHCNVVWMAEESNGVSPTSAYVLLFGHDDAMFLQDNRIT